jgi:hypothetical protein
MLENKRAIIDLSAEMIVFIVLNVLVFSLLVFFLHTASSGAVIYEQSYAKQVGLLLDQAKPNTEFSIDISDGIKIANKNSIDLNKIVNINSYTHVIKINLGSATGYSFTYFSDYNVETKIEGNLLIISIKGR